MPEEEQVNSGEAAVTAAAQKGASSVGKLGMALGAGLIVQGLVFYRITGGRSLTAAIPTAFGVPLMLSSWYMRANAFTKDTKSIAFVAHIAVVVSLIGALSGVGMGISGVIKGKATTTIADCLLMGAVSGLHVIASVNHFMKMAKLKRAVKSSQKSK